MTRRILVTGGTGQLAAALTALGRDRVHVVGRPGFDFDRPETIAATFRDAEPSLVVNAAAYTAVDAAETDAAAAWRANRDGPAELARLCASAGVPLIHVSTDYVYDGAKSSPYVETDSTNPTSAYGASKLAGEIAAREAWEQTIILRTSWVYAPAGRNFVLTMLALARTRWLTAWSVVSDQRGYPTAGKPTWHAAILAIATQIETCGWKDQYGGVFHAAGSGETTWHGFAIAVFTEAARHGIAFPSAINSNNHRRSSPGRRSGPPNPASGLCPS